MRIAESLDAAYARRRLEVRDYDDWLAGKIVPDVSHESVGPEDKLIPGLEFAVRRLAAVYADHPDYDEAWRP